MTTPGDPLYGPHRCTCSPTVFVCPACRAYGYKDHEKRGLRGKRVKNLADLAARRVLYEAEYTKALEMGQTIKANQYRHKLKRLAKWKER